MNLVGQAFVTSTTNSETFSLGSMDQPSANSKHHFSTPGLSGNPSNQSIPEGGRIKLGDCDVQVVYELLLQINRQPEDSGILESNSTVTSSTEMDTSGNLTRNLTHSGTNTEIPGHTNSQLPMSESAGGESSELPMSQGFEIFQELPDSLTLPEIMDLVGQPSVTSTTNSKTFSPGSMDQPTANDKYLSTPGLPGNSSTQSVSEGGQITIGALIEQLLGNEPQPAQINHQSEDSGIVQSNLTITSNTGMDTPGNLTRNITHSGTNTKNSGCTTLQFSVSESAGGDPSELPISQMFNTLAELYDYGTTPKKPRLSDETNQETEVDKKEKVLR